MIDKARQLQVLRVVHHRLFGSYPRIYPTPVGISSGSQWTASSNESAKTVYGEGKHEDDALIDLIDKRIAGSFGHEYKRELAP